MLLEEFDIEELGTLVLGAAHGRLCLCDWRASLKHKRHREDAERLFPGAGTAADEAVIGRARRQVREFLVHDRTEFTLPLLPIGSAFQSEVWQALQRVPYGHTITYAALAQRLGRPKAQRAVASAVAANPLSLFIPCHRVVPSNGPWPGSYAGGASAKRWLLLHEAEPYTPSLFPL